MALPFYSHDLVFLRPPKVADAHGNTSRKTKDWANAMRAVPVRGVAQQDASRFGSSLASEENRERGREQVDTTLRVWVDDDLALEWVDAPAEADTSSAIKVTDGVEVDGVLYDLRGQALPMPDPFGGLGHLVMKVQRVWG